MSVDNWDQEWHLTPGGWVRGTSKYYHRVDSEVVARPADAVESWEVHSEQRSAWSRDEVTETLVWRDPAVSEERLKALYAKFKRPF